MDTKLKKAQDAITAMRPYSDKLTQMLVDLSASVDFENEFLQSRETNKLLVVCVTSNRGLCGAFNSNVIKECLEIANKVAGFSTTRLGAGDSMPTLKDINLKV